MCPDVIIGYKTTVKRWVKGGVVSVAYGIVSVV